jgi:hypothetical protein
VEGIVKGAAAAPAKPKERGVHGTPIVLGLSHKTATVEVREKLSISEAQWNAASAALCKYDSIQEAAVLSTCNRFEVYIVATDPFTATRDAMAFLREHSGLDDRQLRPNLFVLQNEDATWHLLRVASGLGKVSSEPYLPETRVSLSVVLTTMVYSHHDGFFTPCSAEVLPLPVALCPCAPVCAH